MEKIETFDMDYLKDRAGAIKYVLKTCPKEIFHDNYHMFRLFEYFKCWDAIVDKHKDSDGDFIYVDVGSCRSYLPYLIAVGFPEITVYMTDLAHISTYFLWGEPEWPSNLKFEKVNCMSMSKTLGSNSVDIISCISVIEHADDEGLVYKEMMDTLKPGGELLMTTDIDFKEPQDFHPRRYNSELMKVRHDTISPQIPFEMDISSEADQLARWHKNKEIYEAMDDDIKKEIELYSTHYMTGFFKMIKG